MPIYQIQAGCRSREALDWTRMLLSMYERWAIRNGHNFLCRPTGEQGLGIHRAFFMVDCEPDIFASEIGVHRLVRISPFDPEQRRHTSFAEISTDRASEAAASFGAQIRSYVFSPYLLVKDTRTKAETKDAHTVLDGHIELFLEAYQKLNTPEAGSGDNNRK